MISEQPNFEIYFESTKKLKFFLSSVTVTCGLKLIDLKMSGSDAEKRNLSASSMEESSPKREKREDTEPPAWARSLIADVSHCVNNTNAIKLTVDGLKHELTKVKDDVEAMEVRLARLEMKDAARDAEMAELKQENVALRASNDKLTDESLRDSLSIHHIPRKQGKETWDDTKQILAKFLAENSTSSEAQWTAKISRAHRNNRSTSNVIHALFKDWEYSQEVKELFRQKKGKIGQVFVLDKFSINTQSRRNLAQARRDVERARVPGSKLYVKYPAVLMCQRPGEEGQGYKIIAEF